MLTIAAHSSNELGECPLWCERTRRLYWTDIEGRELLAMQEVSRAEGTPQSQILQCK